MLETETFHGQAACILDSDGCFVNVSPSLAAFFRMDGRRLRGRRLTSWLEPTEAARLEPSLAGLGHGGTGTYRFEVSLLGPDRVPARAVLRLAPGGRDSDGRPLLVATFEGPPRGD